jgi:hypothetical protein
MTQRARLRGGSRCCLVAVRLLYACQAGIDGSAILEFTIGSGPGIRTLNLVVNRSLHPVQEWHPEFAECR